MKKVTLLLIFTTVFFTLYSQPISPPGGDCPSPQASTLDPDPESFTPICDDPTVIRYLPVAIHFVLRETPMQFSIEDGCDETLPTYTFYSFGNFTATSDGLGNPYNGFQRAEDLIEEANDELANNNVHSRKNPSLPTSHYDPAPDINYRYILKGVYFHKNDDFWNDPRGKYRTYHPQYDVGGNSVIDVYMAPNDPSGVASGLGPANKYCHVANWYTYAAPQCANWSKTAGGATINHEIGHLLNLIHTWDRNDGCSDTPMGFLFDLATNKQSDCDYGTTPCCQAYANCWRFGAGDNSSCGLKPCDDWSKVTNNIMDYCQPYQRAMTAHQIGRVNTNLAHSTGNSYVHSCNGCVPAQAHFYSLDHYTICCLPASVIISGEGSYNEDEYLFEICEVASATSTTCLSGTYYSAGWASGSVGVIDLAQVYTFAADKFYKVTLTVDSDNCPQDDVFEDIIETVGCPTPSNDLSGLSPISPFSGSITVSYTVNNPGNMTMYLTHMATGQTTIIGDAYDQPVGNHQMTANTSSLPPGSYQVTAVFNGVPHYATAVKI